ncbi:hypothetical protein [Cesiribacter sp. SM1]|uniref:hypothetical protein n=1 Tax=Cesiribacter sp. SM1 TaxID=2861196 RepID=UPI001CD72B77|nr:hypothetical protein [Cesiribacter sp. SM1]
MKKFRFFVRKHDAIKLENLGHIEIRIIGKTGNLDLKPDNYDIKEIIAVLQAAENLLFPNNKKDRPLISYSIEEGSVKHIIKTSFQAVIGFNAIIGQVESTNSIDFLESQSARALETFQENAVKKGFEIEITTSLENSHKLLIDRSTTFYRTQNVWVDAEFYFYGTLTNAGGKSKPNIHLDTDEFGSLTITTDKAYLQEKEENFLYKKYGVRALGKQNIETGELDKTNLQLIELIDFNPKFDKSYLSSLMKKASNSWKGVTDADDWMSQLRGGYDA